MKFRPTHAKRPRIVLAAAAATLSLAVAAALLPLAGNMPPAGVVGWLLLLAGCFELGAGAARGPGEFRTVARLAGCLTTLTGLLFVLNPFAGFFPLSYVVMGWLFLRGAILLGAGVRFRGPLQGWAIASGLADILLGLTIILGLPLAALVVSLFGPTREIVASFAFILAASFLVTGLSLLAAAGVDRRRDASEEGMQTAAANDNTESRASDFHDRRVPNGTVPPASCEPGRRPR